MQENKTNLENRRAKLLEDLNFIREKTLEKKYTLKNFILSLLAGFGILFGVFFIEDRSFDIFADSEFLFFIAIFSLTLSVFIFLGYPLVQILFYRISERKILLELASIGSETLQDEIETDFFTNLVKINFKYIDKYYLQTQIQADKSFTLSLVISIVAFLIIISGIILMYFNNINSAYIATGAGVLSQFISAVFFYLYNKTITKMGEYHHKLVLTQNISLALKITEQMSEEEKVIAQNKLIEELTRDINKYIAYKPEI